MKQFEVYCTVVKFTIQHYHFQLSCSSDPSFGYFADLICFSGRAAASCKGFVAYFEFVIVFSYWDYFHFLLIAEGCPISFGCLYFNLWNLLSYFDGCFLEFCRYCFSERAYCLNNWWKVNLGKDGLNSLKFHFYNYLFGCH